MEFPFPMMIHQTWESDNCAFNSFKQLPDSYKESITKWKKFHPGWKHRFTTSEENRIFVIKHFPQYKETYDSFPHAIQRSYMIRYMYLYQFGGVYADLSIIPTRSLQEYEFSSTSDLYLCKLENEVVNSFIICKPKCNVWLDVLHHSKLYKKWFFTLPQFEISNSIGNHALTKILTNYTILPSRLFLRSQVHAMERKDIYNYIESGLSSTTFVTYIHAIYHNRKLCLLFLLVMLTLVLVYRYVYR